MGKLQKHDRAPHNIYVTLRALFGICLLA